MAIASIANRHFTANMIPAPNWLAPTGEAAGDDLNEMHEPRCFGGLAGGITAALAATAPQRQLAKVAPNYIGLSRRAFAVCDMRGAGRAGRN